MSFILKSNVIRTRQWDFGRCCQEEQVLSKLDEMNPLGSFYRAPHLLKLPAHVALEC